MGQVAGLLQTIDARYQGPRACGDDDSLGPELLIADGDAPAGEDPGGAVDGLDALFAYGGRVVVGLDPADDLAHAAHHSSELEIELGGAEPHLVGASGVVQGLSSADQSLAGNAPGPQAFAAESVLLDEGGPGPEGG